MLVTGVVNKKAAFTTMATVHCKYLTICLIHPLIHPPAHTTLIKKLMGRCRMKWFSHNSMYLKWMNPYLRPNPCSKNNTSVALSLLQVWFGHFCRSLQIPQASLLCNQLPPPQINHNSTGGKSAMTNLSVDLRDLKRYILLFTHVAR